MRYLSTGILLLALAGAAWCQPALAAAPACGPHATDDTLRPLPLALAPAAMRVFGLHGITPAQMARSTVVRCLNGQLLACNYGANLPCGKANMAAALPAGNAWCRKNPNANYIPAYITGHDSAYAWHCVAGAPKAGAAMGMDARGFIGKYWRVVG